MIDKKHKSNASHLFRKFYVTWRTCTIMQTMQTDSATMLAALVGVILISGILLLIIGWNTETPPAPVPCPAETPTNSHCDEVIYLFLDMYIFSTNQLFSKWYLCAWSGEWIFIQIVVIYLYDEAHFFHIGSWSFSTLSFSWHHAAFWVGVVQKTILLLLYRFIIINIVAC